jgi:hypothetical protein
MTKAVAAKTSSRWILGILCMTLFWPGFEHEPLEGMHFDVDLRGCIFLVRHCVTRCLLQSFA